jgi:hypothetical protein
MQAKSINLYLPHVHTRRHASRIKMQQIKLHIHTSRAGLLASTPLCKLPRLACTHASRLRVTPPCMKQIDRTSSYADRLRRAPTTSTTSRAALPSSDHVDPRPRRPRPEQLCRAPTTTTSTTSRAALPSSDHVDHQTTTTTSRAAPQSSDHQTTRPRRK